MPNQTFTDFEFYIIDDCSTDNSLNIIKSFSDDRIKVIQNKINKGYVHGLNLALSYARGKFIARMDSDDYSFPDRLKKQFEFLDRNRDYILCGTYHELMGMNTVITHPDNHHAILQGLLWGSVFCHPSVMINRDLFFTHKLKYNSIMTPAEDYDLWTEIAKIPSVKLINLPEVLFSYRVHDAQISNQKQRLQENNSLEIRIKYVQWYLFNQKKINISIKSLELNELINFLRQIEELLKLNNEKIQPLEPILINLIEKTREYIVYNTNFFNVKSLLQILLKDVKILLNQPKKRIITYFFSCFFSSLK